MATTFGIQANKVLGVTKSTPSPGFVHGTVRTFTEQVSMASQAAADIIVIGMIPKGSVFLSAIIETDTSTSTATLALSTVTLTAAGVATVASAGKYGAAVAYTATNTPTLVGPVAAVGVATTADDIIGLVVATASLPASGLLRVTLFYSHN